MLCSQMPAGTNGQQTLLQLQPAEIKGSERGRPANLTPELGEIDQRPQPATRRQVSKCSHQRLVTKWCVCSVAQSSLIYFEFIFVYGVRNCSNFILLHAAVQFSQHHLLKRLCAPFSILASFFKN